MSYVAHKKSTETCVKIHRLTQVILGIFWFSELSLKSLQTMFAALEKTNTFHMRHSVALLIIYAVCQVDLVGK